jgi:uncharacterized membrane protein
MGERSGIRTWGAGLLALALIAAAIWFRCAGLLDESMWLDEAYSAYAAGKSFDFLWHVVPLYETHPPFYYSLLRLWTLAFGDSLAALRALGIVCGLATLPMILLAARELARLLRLDRPPMLGLLLATLALACFSVSLVEMSREVRPYPVLILVYATAHFALFRLGRRSRDGDGIGSGAYVLYLLALALTLWLHNLGPLYGLAMGLALLALVLRPGLSRRDWLWLIGGHAVVAALYLPALRIMLDQAPTWISSTWLKFSFTGLQTKLAALYALPGLWQELAALLLALLAVRALLRMRDGWRVAVALAALAIVPVAVSIALSVWIAPVFIMRTMTPVAVPAILLLATGATAQRGAWRWPALGALLLIVSQTIVVDIHARRAGGQQDWYGTVRWVAARFRPGDIVYAYPNEGALPFDFAARDLSLDLPSRAVPTPVPSLGVGGWNPTGSRGVVSLSRDRLRAIARSPEAEAVPTIWLLRLGPWAYDKGDVFLEELSHDRRRVGRWQSGPIDIIGLRKVSPGPAAPAGAAAAR